MLNPAKYFLTLLHEKLNKNGINARVLLDTAKTPKNANKFFTYERPLTEVIRTLNKMSGNLEGEMILRAMGYEYFGRTASGIKGLKLIDSLAIQLGFNPEDYVFADGSGLSHYNLISTEFILEILKHFYYKEPALYSYLYESFPIAGIDGTLKKRMRSYPTLNNVRAKTGTFSGVSSLSGYMTNKSNHLVAFSIIINNYSGSPRKARKIQDKICEIIYGL